MPETRPTPSMDQPMTFVTGSGHGLLTVSFRDAEDAASEWNDDLRAYHRLIQNASSLSHAAELAWDEARLRAAH